MASCSRLALVVASALLLASAGTVSAGHAYKRGDLITLFANKVGPFQNPTETYQFYNLPFCQPTGGKEYKLEDLGEVGCALGRAAAHPVLLQTPSSLLPGVLQTTCRTLLENVTITGAGAGGRPPGEHAIPDQIPPGH